MAKKSFLDYFKIGDSNDEDFEDDLFDEDENEYYDDDTEDDAADYDDDYDTKDQKSRAIPLKPFKSRGTSSDASDTGRRTSRQSNQGNASNNKLVSINSRSGRAADENEVFVIKPDEFDDAQMIIDHLNRGQIIVINMEDLDLPTAQRIADFIGGASYAIDGLFQAISGNIFLATPSGTYVSGDLREELAESSLQRGTINSKANY